MEELRSMKLKEDAKMVEDGIEKTLTYCYSQSGHWIRSSTNNVIERLNRKFAVRPVYWEFFEWQSCPYAGYWLPAGKQEVHEKETPRGWHRGRLNCWLTSFTPGPEKRFMLNF